MRAALGVTGYPAVELMTLVETGTRALLGAVFGLPATGETDYARRLLARLGPDILVLADRGFDGAAFLTEAAGTGAQFLVRLCPTRRPPVLARLDDGSFLSRIGALTVRIITADITVTCADGTRYTASYRLVTTLVDPRRHPAAALIALYHERWEHEIAYLALRHTLLQGRVLNRPTPTACGRNVGLAAHRLSSAAHRHGGRGRNRPRHRPRPGQHRHRPGKQPKTCSSGPKT